MDIERVRYSLARYLRTRILKIERNLEYILSSIDVMDRLSMNEKIFATKLNNLNNSYFEDNVSNRFQQSDAKEYYESSENRLRNAQPSDRVSSLVPAPLCGITSTAVKLTPPSSERPQPVFSLANLLLLSHFLLCISSAELRILPGQHGPARLARVAGPDVHHVERRHWHPSVRDY
jgi:hypothetical protein